jgi:hypothetical protein
MCLNAPTFACCGSASQEFAAAPQVASPAAASSSAIDFKGDVVGGAKSVALALLSSLHGPPRVEQPSTPLARTVLSLVTAAVLEADVVEFIEPDAVECMLDFGVDLRFRALRLHLGQVMSVSVMACPQRHTPLLGEASLGRSLEVAKANHSFHRGRSGVAPRAGTLCVSNFASTSKSWSTPSNAPSPTLATADAPFFKMFPSGVSCDLLATIGLFEAFDLAASNFLGDALDFNVGEGSGFGPCA